MRKAVWSFVTWKLFTSQHQSAALLFGFTASTYGRHSYANILQCHNTARTDKEVSNPLFNIEGSSSSENVFWAVTPRNLVGG